MAMGLPIVISVPEGEATEIVITEKAGLIVPPENSENLAGAILKLKNDIELHSTLAVNSGLAAGKFNRKILALDMLHHIEELMGP